MELYYLLHVGYMHICGDGSKLGAYIHPVTSLSSSCISLHFPILSSLYERLGWDEVTILPSKTSRNMAPYLDLQESDTQIFEGFDPKRPLVSH